MIPVQFTLHAVNLILFGVVLYIHAQGYREVLRCRASQIIKRLGKNVMLAGMAIAALFLLLQADWVLSAHNQSVGDAVSWSWLLFDYALAVYLLINGTLIRVFAQWRGNGLQQSKRRSSDAVE